MPQNDAERVAQAAYDNPGADWFYLQIWGGEDIHLGLYQEPGESIAVASRRTMEHMADRLGQRTVTDVVDLGSGYGGAARFLHERLGASVLAVNVSPTQNQRARTLNREAARVLRPGGELLFTDPMATDDTPRAELGPVLDRLRLPSLGSPSRYREHAAAAGLVEVGFEDHSPQLATHYDRVLEETRARMEDLRRSADEEFLDRMVRGLESWVDAGTRGLLAWGIFHFRRP